MRIINLGSGSKGNATLLKIKSGYILIDCGLSRLEEKLKEANVLLEEIKYVFITHNHTDHTLNIAKFPSNIIYCGKETVSCEHNTLDYYKNYDFEDFSVFTLKTSHDAPNPFGYIFNIEGSEVVYITDTGRLPAKTQKFIVNRRFYIIESNYDLDLLMSSPRPLFLKNRIKSTKGHLSNLQTELYLKEFIGDNTYGVVYAHISEECNNDEKVLEKLENFKHLPVSSFLKQWEPTFITYDEN